jgi:hypothetical protein
MWQLKMKTRFPWSPVPDVRIEANSGKKSSPSPLRRRRALVEPGDHRPDPSLLLGPRPAELLWIDPFLSPTFQQVLNAQTRLLGRNPMLTDPHGHRLHRIPLRNLLLRSASSATVCSPSCGAAPESPALNLSRNATSWFR